MAHGHTHGAPPQQGPFPLPGVSNIIAVGSGKGGVGKTTIAVNLAVALAKMGYRTGLLDADIYGPNVPLMMNTNSQPRVLTENRIEPLQNFGVKIISVGFLNPGDKPLVWRGPMLHQIIRQFLQQVVWGELDYLVVDLPPGTGDVVISLFQTVPLTGAVVVSTPSDVSLQDARKAIEMFRTGRVDILGIVENMSTLSARTAIRRLISSPKVAYRVPRSSLACHFSVRLNSILTSAKVETVENLRC